MDEETYIANVDKVAAEYARRIKAMMDRVRRICFVNGLEVSKVEDITDEINEIVFYAWPGGDRHNEKHDVEVNLSIIESRTFMDGFKGISFVLSGANYYGETAFVLAPEYNHDAFRPLSWVDPTDADAVEKRFAALESMDFSGIPAKIKAMLAKGPCTA
jgi:hypothetical protein